MKGAKSKSISDAEQVAAYMDALEHPLKPEIDQVRRIIRDAHPGIAERIKWNAPSYYCREDLVTFHIRPQHHVHLVFHHAEIVNIPSPLLEGDYKDRRMAYFRDMAEVEAQQAELTRILNELVRRVQA
ncbi:MAG: DUF1801 domain-containing protein [Saprospiraceae bacterium]|nr:DUF1801 domain-containing protein [Saprospiraceae bacterium]